MIIKKYIYFILAIGTILLIIDGLLTNNNHKFNLFSIELNKPIYLSVLSIFTILFIAFGVKKR